MFYPSTIDTDTRLRRIVFVSLRIPNLFPGDRSIWNLHRVPRRPLKELQFRGPDKAPQQIYRPWVS